MRGGRSPTRFVALVLPVSAFIAAGFEHCVANMYFLPLAWLLTQTGHVPADFDASIYYDIRDHSQSGPGHTRQYRRWGWLGRRCVLGYLSRGVWRDASRARSDHAFHEVLPSLNVLRTPTPSAAGQSPACEGPARERGLPYRRCADRSISSQPMSFDSSTSW